MNHNMSYREEEQGGESEGEDDSSDSSEGSSASYVSGATGLVTDFAVRRYDDDDDTYNTNTSSDDDGDGNLDTDNDEAKEASVIDLVHQIEAIDLERTAASQRHLRVPNNDTVPVQVSHHNRSARSSRNLRKVATWLTDGTCRKVVILSGAGVSCSAGIPDFRSPGTGLYDNLQKYNLPYPEAVFDLRFYQNNPQPFCSLAKEIWPGVQHSPTLTHSFVTLLDQKGLLVRNYTQNIDGLEVMAGVSEERIVECHGHFRTASCVACKQAHDGTDCQMKIVQEAEAPTCTSCGNYVKPDIVFFGEDLPPRFNRLLRSDLDEADLLIVMGTSLTVAPVSLIPDMVNNNCKRVLFNRECVGNFKPNKKKSSGSRDVVEEGDCDESIQALCQLLGWHDELLELHRSKQLA